MERYEIRNAGGIAKVSTNETDKSAGAEVGYLHYPISGNNGIITSDKNRSEFTSNSDIDSDPLIMQNYTIPRNI